MKIFNEKSFFRRQFIDIWFDTGNTNSIFEIKFFFLIYFLCAL